MKLIQESVAYTYTSEDLSRIQEQQNIPLDCNKIRMSRSQWSETCVNTHGKYYCWPSQHWLGVHMYIETGFARCNHSFCTYCPLDGKLFQWK